MLPQTMTSQVPTDQTESSDYADGFMNSTLDPCRFENSSFLFPEFNCSSIDEDFGVPHMAQLYQWLLIFVAIATVVSIFTNLLVLFSARYIRKITPTIFFSLSLVAANAYAIVIFTLSLTINSFLKYYIDWEPNTCYALLLEVFRMTGLSASALHLVALAINHYVGILRPLHYASTVTRRRLTLVIIALWVVPFIIYSYLIINQSENNFYNLDCHNDFMTQMPFRLTLSLLFCFPLLIMTFLYIHIFITIKRNHRGFLQEHKNQPGTQHIKRNVKAVITTLLIIGTYLIGYMPAAVFYVLTCNECPCPLSKLAVRTRLYFGISTNCLIFVKCLCDPIIYTIRMPEVRNGLRRMWLTRCCSKYIPGTLGSDRKRTMTSLRSDMMPLNRRSLQERGGHLTQTQKENGHKPLSARTTLNSSAQTETALA